jgi:AcrR family transcriptional regulator
MSHVTGATPESASQTRLLEAAVESFAARGFHGTTTRDIATAAGMSPAAVYVHHRSKEDLLHLISRRGHERTLRLVQDAIASRDEPADQLRAFVRAFAAHHARNHTTARIVNYELAALTDPHLAEVAAVRRAIEHEVRSLVERGVEAGAFDVPDPPMTALALLSLGIDVARWYRDEGSWTPEDVADHYADLALRMVGAR